MERDKHAPSDSSPVEAVDLAGSWNFSLDPDDVGIQSNWFEQTLEESISLPGTTDEAHVGEPTTGRETHHLTRTQRYEGPAWYQRTVEVPPAWRDKRVTLFLECSRKTTLWVDDIEVGTQRSLSTPHEYDLTPHVDSGTYTLTVRVDNDSPPVTFESVQNSHQVTAETQTNWNGIIGDLRLRATDPVWIDDTRVTFDDETIAKVELDFGNLTGEQVTGHVRTRVSTDSADECGTGSDSSTPGADTIPSSVSINPGYSRVSVEYDCSDGDYRWDEFDPGVHELVMELNAGTGDDEFRHVTTTSIGRCAFERDGTQFTSNGRTTFLRGTVDCCVFPETGYAPMGTDEWRSVFETATRYGINHYRFHSWCPPEAAFTAADELGIYLQPELPFWGEVFESEDAKQFYYDEVEAILDAYGNHPSFVLFALGNELSGSRRAARRLVSHCRDYDDRHLYAAGSNSFHAKPELVDGDDFWVTMMTGGAYDPGSLDAVARADGLVRGSFSPHTLGHVNNTEPTTDVDYSEAIAEVDVPVIGHEIGQYQTYPSYDEIEKYVGVLEPRNLSLFRDHLAAHGMVDRDTEFQQASGNLAAKCYREEMEAALRTDGFGGFQLLGLQDFPGQGTALVGMLDAFMDEKGIIEAEQWRESCGPVIALARMSSRVWRAGTTVSVSLQVANYGPETIQKATPYWKLCSMDGERVASDRAAPTTIQQGDLNLVATAEIDLEDTDSPASLVLEVGIEDTDITNAYDVWVFPQTVTAPDEGIVIRQTYDSETRARLRDGDNVLLLAPKLGWSRSLDGAFQPDYWAYGSDWKRRQAPPGTMGLQIDHDHPALATFPTAYHSDWQWWHIAKQSNPVILDDLGGEYEPIVRAIDNVERNRNLGLIFEGTVEDGAFLACAADLRSIDDPAAEQLLHGLSAYLGSDSFDPTRQFSERQMAKLFGY